MRPQGVVLLGVCLVLSTASARGLAQAPLQTDGWVVIPVDDYRSLRAKAYPVEPSPAPPPVDAALTRLTYDLTLAGDSVIGTATADIDVLKDGWVEVLIPTGLLVRDARLDGRPVSLIDHPSPHVLLSKRGRSQLTLQIVLPVTPAGPAESVVIPPAPAALVEASLQIPRDGVEMSVANGFVSGQTQNAGATRWTAYGRANAPLTFAWRRRVDDQRAGQPLRFRGSVVSLVGLGEDSTQITATVKVEVMQGLARSVTLAVPAGVAINQVSGPLVADWDTAGAGELHIVFLEPVTTTTSITINGDVRGPRDGIVPVPLLRLPDAERETGGVAVEVLGAGEIVERQPQALEPADAFDLGSVVRGRESPSLVAFRYKAMAGRDPRALAVRVSRYATQALQVANVDEARYQVLIAEDGKSLVKARYAVRNNHRSLLTVALPADATLWQASVAGRPVRPGRSTEGALLVPLEKVRAREDLPPFVVEIVYVAPTVVWTDKGSDEVTLPALDLPVSRTGVELHYSPRFRVASTTGSFRVEPYAGPFSPTLMEREAVMGGAETATAPAAPSLADKDEGAAAMKELVDLPGKPSDVRISPGAITRTAIAGDLTHVEATLVPGTRATVSWSSRESTTPTTPQEARTLADIKTMVSVGEAEARMTALVDLIVLRGEPDRFEVRLPPGFSATGASGSALASSEERPGAIVLVVQRPADRRHQFLLSLERAIGDVAAIETPLLSVSGAERETGEVAVEATGTVDLTAQENDTLRRMDVREASATLRSLARSPILAALRYHRQGTNPAVLSLNVTRFPDAAVVAAVAERATVTTLVTSEGRTLTEIALTMRNRAQPFLRVELPQGASVVSAEVEGETSKPALSADGARIPLLRPGFRPTGPYAVSFVYIQDGQSFAKKGRAEFALPKMDVPVTLVEWEMFVPDKSRIRRFDGNALPMPAGAPAGAVGGMIGELLTPGVNVGSGHGGGIGPGVAAGVGGGVQRTAQSGQIIGVVTDSSSAMLPGVTVRARRGDMLVSEAITDSTGWFRLSNVVSGPVTIEASLPGFRPGRVDLTFDATNARRVDFQLPLGATAESVAVTAADTAAPPEKPETSADQKQREESYAQAPSLNVFSLQRRVAGVLPVRVDVPRAGAAYRFIRPLVLDETTRVSFEYRMR